MHNLDATTVSTTTVRIELDGRPALIRDLQHALDVFKAEGIPDTFEVTFRQHEDRDSSDTDIPYSERPVIHRMWIEAQRAATFRTSDAIAAMLR